MLAQVTAKISGIPFIVHSVHTDKQICSSILQLFLTVLAVQYVRQKARQINCNPSALPTRAEHVYGKGKGAYSRLKMQMILVNVSGIFHLL